MPRCCTKLLKEFNDPRLDLAQEEIVEWKQKRGGVGWDCTTWLGRVFHLFCLVLFLSASHFFQDRDHLQLHVCGST